MELNFVIIEFYKYPIVLHFFAYIDQLKLLGCSWRFYGRDDHPRKREVDIYTNLAQDPESIPIKSDYCNNELGFYPPSFIDDAT